MKKVLVIVVTYNGKQWLSRCLGSVSADGVSVSAVGVPETVPPTANKAQNEVGGTEIVPSIALKADLFVVDNDSTDGSADFVQANFPAAKLIRSAENLGFSKANNLGMQYAMDHGYDYVYLLNQDAWLEEGSLDKLVAAAEAHPKYAVLSPLQMTDGFKELDRLFKKDKTPPAAHWLVPVEALRKVGLFNEDLFPLYGQDDNWCHRARYHGYQIAIIPEARAVHDRARRIEAKEKIIDRNYRIGSLIRLCDINRPLWERLMNVCLFTIVKSVKYFSFKPLKYFVGICKQLPTIKLVRKNCK